ncbi:MAG: prolipoprotein diacylglyceryl transferase [Anaerolineaceae bacterium]|nr:prolipoprotein diacylglyceryl transferase [Anaerolineaceae bacterium]
MREFSLLVGFGASLGLLRVFLLVPIWQAPKWLNAGLVTLSGCLIGARLAYVAPNWGYFDDQLLEVPQFWLGGLSWVGAVTGGLLVMLLISHFRPIPLGKLADMLVLMIPPLGVSIWLGCWVAGIAYGPLASEGALWGIPARDEFGVLMPRFPLQLLASASLLVYCLLVEKKLLQVKRTGQAAVLMFIGLAGNMLLFTFLRSDPAPEWYGLRQDAWAAAFFFGISLVSMIVFYVRPLRAR